MTRVWEVHYFFSVLLCSFLFLSVLFKGLRKLKSGKRESENKEKQGKAAFDGFEWTNVDDMDGMDDGAPRCRQGRRQGVVPTSFNGRGCLASIG